MILLFVIGSVSGYGGCPGDRLSFLATGELEQWKCQGNCQPVNKPCGEKLDCYKGDGKHNTFHLWNSSRVSCERDGNWTTSVSYTHLTLPTKRIV